MKNIFILLIILNYTSLSQKPIRYDDGGAFYNYPLKPISEFYKSYCNNNNFKTHLTWGDFEYVREFLEKNKFKLLESEVIYESDCCEYLYLTCIKNGQTFTIIKENNNTKYAIGKLPKKGRAFPNQHFFSVLKPHFKKDNIHDLSINIYYKRNKAFIYPNPFDDAVNICDTFKMITKIRKPIHFTEDYIEIDTTSLCENQKLKFKKYHYENPYKVNKIFSKDSTYYILPYDSIIKFKGFVYTFDNGFTFNHFETLPLEEIQDPFGRIQLYQNIGLIDKTGKEIISHRFERIYPLFHKTNQTIEESFFKCHLNKEVYIYKYDQLICKIENSNNLKISIEKNNLVVTNSKQTMKYPIQ